MGSPAPIWLFASISSIIVDQVSFLRRFDALPRIYKPCFARESATLMRFLLCELVSYL